MHTSLVDSAVLPQVTYAGLGRRVAAHLLDLVIAFAVTMATGLFLAHLRTLGWWKVAEEGQDPAALWRGLSISGRLAVIMAFVISKGPIYSGLLQASAWQATIGKRLLGLYVTDTAGGRLDLLRSLGRSFAKDIFNTLPLVGVVSLATIVATGRKQALHDYAARTVVMNGRPHGDGSLGLWRIVVGFGVQSLWYAGTMVVLFGR